MSDSNEDKYFFTPSFRATLIFLWNVNERKKIGKNVVGNDKYTLKGFFDPSDPDAGPLFQNSKAALLTAGATDAEATAAMLEAFPLNSALQTPVDGIPPTWRRLSMASKYGPVDVTNRSGGQVKETEVYRGIHLIAQVSAFPFQDQKTSAHCLALRLGPVLLDRAGEKLKSASGPSAKQVFAGLIGGTSTVDPFAGKR